MLRRGLESVEVIAERPQRVLVEGSDDGFVFDAQSCKFYSFRLIGRSAMDARFFHLATVFRLTCNAGRRPQDSLGSVVSLDAPLLSWCSLLRDIMPSPPMRVLQKSQLRVEPNC